MALPLPPGLTPPEIAFICEMELVTIIPRQRLEGLGLLGVRVPRYTPPSLPWPIMSIREPRELNIDRCTGSSETAESAPKSFHTVVARSPTEETTAREHRPAAMAGSRVARGDIELRDRHRCFLAAAATSARAVVHRGAFLAAFPFVVHRGRSG